MTEREARQRAFRLADQLMSPFCPGLLLSSCQSSGAADLRREMATRLAAGEPEADILADLVHRYGAGIQGAPPAQGIGAVVWSTPAVLGAGTLSLLVFALVRLRTRTARSAAPVRDEGLLTDAQDTRLAAELDAELDALD